MKIRSELVRLDRKRTSELRLSNRRQKLGKQGEILAAEFLESNGYLVLDRNALSCCGELDVVARRGNELVFVEVKARSGAEFGIAEAVPTRKMSRMRRAAGAWLASNSGSWESVRFDVITVELGSGSSPVITHYEAVDRGAR